MSEGQMQETKKSPAELALEEKLKALTARREANAEKKRLAELQAEVLKNARELEEDELEEKLKAERPGEELGIHFDFLRFGAYLVAFKKAPGPLVERWTKRLPEKGQPHPAEVRNLARPCVLGVYQDGEELGGEAFDRVAEDFPGAPIDIVNVLLAMTSGAAARRRKK